MPQSAHGAVLRVGTTSDPSSTSISFTDIATVSDITGPSESMNFTEVTNHESSVIERIAVLSDPGTLDFDLEFDPEAVTHGTGSSGLRGLLRNQTKRVFRLDYPNTTGTVIDEMVGFVADFEPSAPQTGGDSLSATVSLQIVESISEVNST